MPLYERPHMGRENRICEIVEKGATFDEYYDLTRNSKFVCRHCGPIAARAENLGEPTDIPSS